MNEEELIRETRKLIGRWDNVRIVGQGWAGDARRGFEFNPIRTRSEGATTPVTPTGACCPEDGDCFISTQAVCEGGGGTYQGDNTTCDPDPCPTTPTGACCVGTDCTIETEDDCTGMGGTYQGDGTDCDPNPCETTCEGCFFDGFLGEHKYKFQTVTVEESVDCAGFSGSNSFNRTSFLDPNNSCFDTCLDASGTSDCAGFSCDAGVDPCHKDYSCSGFPGGDTCFGLFDNASLGWCSCLTGFDTIVSDSVLIETCSGCAGCAGDSSYTVTVTLFGICSDA